MKGVRLILAAVLAASTAGCGAPAPSTAPSAAPPPSASGPAQMICSDEAGEEIEATLGVRPSQPPTPAFSDGRYSCRYAYPSGVMLLAVTQPVDPVAALPGRLPSPVALPGLGDAAYAGPDGSVLVGKDGMILAVDVSGLPERFGEPPLPRAQVAIAVANVILDCWT